MGARWRWLARTRAAWFGVDTDWERVPADPARAFRYDALLALGFLVTGSLGVELLRSIDALGNAEDSWLWPHVAVVARHRAARLADGATRCSWPRCSRCTSSSAAC